VYILSHSTDDRKRLVRLTALFWNNKEQQRNAAELSRATRVGWRGAHPNESSPELGLAVGHIRRLTRRRGVRGAMGRIVSDVSLRGSDL
jgi:hypothetical protein